MIPYVTAVIVVVVVEMDMRRTVLVDVKSTHAYASARSIDTTRNSSPVSSLTSKLPQLPQAKTGRSKVDSAPHWPHKIVAGTCSITNSAGEELPTKEQCIGHHLAQVPDPYRDLFDRTPVGMLDGGAHNGLAEREFVHRITFPRLSLPST